MRSNLHFFSFSIDPDSVRFAFYSLNAKLDQGEFAFFSSLHMVPCRSGYHNLIQGAYNQNGHHMTSGNKDFWGIVCLAGTG